MRRALSVGMAIGLFVVAAGLASGLLDSVALAGGCATCGCGPVCEPACGSCCDPCCEPACPPCGAGSAGCGGCIHPLAPVEWVLRFLGGSCCCGGGCPGGCSEETYWGDCGGCASPCDACGNYVGRGPAYYSAPAYAAPAAGCGCAMRTQSVPTQNYVQRAPAAPTVGRSNGYARYPARGQAVPTAYYGDSRQGRVVSVNEQPVTQTQATAARPVRQQYQYTR